MEDVVKAEEYFYSKFECIKLTLLLLFSKEKREIDKRFARVLFVAHCGLCQIIIVHNLSIAWFWFCAANDIISMLWRLFILCSFVATTLDKKGASVTWGSKELQETISSPDRLHLRQILLGHTAKEGEYNVVEVQSNFSWH